MSFLRALEEETGSMFEAIQFIIYSFKIYILLFCFSVGQKQNIIYSGGICLVLICDMAQQNPTVFSNKYPKGVLLVLSILTILTTLK